jgi:DNA polymerase III delta prime subunit
MRSDHSVQAAVSEAHQMASLLVGCETALYMVNRLKAYLDFWSSLPDTRTRTNLEGVMVKLYTHILAFLAHAIDTYQQSSPKRALKSFWQDSDVQSFERNCMTLADQVEIEASTCDRMLREKDSMVMTQSYECLRKVLQELQQIHRVHDSIDRIERKIDLSKLEFVEGATFDAYGQVHTACHQGTRQELLKYIQDWARRPDSKSIFWLQGMAGTGKSTIAWTIADWLSKQQPQDAVNLGASFFFKRGEGVRGSAKFLFPTIVRQLVQKVSGLDKLVAQAAGCNPDICFKLLGEQFQVLIRQPLQQLVPVPSQPVYIIVVDALDECKTDEIDVVLRLWSEVPCLTDIQLRLFVTSRPDLPVQLGFSELSADTHRDVVLHEVPRPVIEHDIFAYLKDKFTTIRKDFNDDPLCDQPLKEDWPGEKVLHKLTDMAVPLFIFAATIYRFVHNSNEDARERLATILSSRRLGSMSQLAQTYMPVLEQLVPSKDNRHTADEERLWDEFRMIVGSIVTLAEPLSRAALATLLRFPVKIVALRLKPLYSVLQIPPAVGAPVRPLHLSFGEFLTSSEAADRPFAVNSTATHAMLLTKCIELLSRPNSEGLRENMCNLDYPGQARQSLTRTQVTACVPPEMQYACRYWVYHAQQGKSEAHDDDVIHTFLKRHFLHWLEALSLMGCLANAIDYVGMLQLLVAVSVCDGSAHRRASLTKMVA